MPEWATSPVYLAAVIGVVVAQRLYVSGEKTKNRDDIKPGVTDAAYKPPHERKAAKLAPAPAAEADAEAEADAPATAASHSDDAQPDAAPSPDPESPGRPFASEAATPEPAGAVVRFGDLSAFTDGSDVWLRKPAAHGALHCKLTDGKPVGAGTEVVGFTPDGAWLVSRTGSTKLTAFPVEGADPVPLLSLPDKAGAPSLGPVHLVSPPGIVLVEISHLAPGASPAMYRIELPSLSAEAEPASPLLAVDTTAPLVPGRPTRWMVDEQTATVRGVLMQDHGVTSLLMRDAEMARQGGERWTATCKRLRLPLPPPDASAPYVFSEWRTVAQWDTASQTRFLGFREGLAWLQLPKAREFVAMDADGRRFELAFVEGE